MGVLKPCQEYQDTACKIVCRVKVFVAHPEEPEFNPWTPHGRRREPIPASCPPAPTDMHAMAYGNQHTCTERETHKVNVKKHFIKHTRPTEHVTPLPDPHKKDT